MAIGVDMGGTNMRLALVKRSGEIDHRIRLESMAKEGPDAVIARIAHAVNELAERVEQEGGRVRAVGLGIPGNILPEEGLVVVSPNLAGFVNFNVHKALMGHVRFPVVIDNDANMIALGEKWCGAGRDFQNFICLTLGTGVGGGLILNGRVWHGAWGSGGEAGHMVIDPHGNPCNCGNNGCLESEASATAIRRKALDALREGKATSLESYRYEPDLLTAEIVAGAAREGDELARQIFIGVGRSLGRAIVNIMNLLGLDAFLVGGGVAAAWELFQPALLEEIRKVSRLFPPERYTVRRVELGDDAGILGSALAAFESVETPGSA